jgi:hypothetical protein
MFLRKDPLKRARLPDVTAGAEVRTADDASLGTVSEVARWTWRAVPICGLAETTSSIRRRSASR